MKSLNIHNTTYSLTSAFVPRNIVALSADVVAVWLQFGCDDTMRESKIKGVEVPISLSSKTTNLKNLAIW